MDEYDSNKDGKITFKDYKTIFERSINSMNHPWYLKDRILADFDGVLREFYNKMRSKHDGFIGKNELNKHNE